MSVASATPSRIPIITSRSRTTSSLSAMASSRSLFWHEIGREGQLVHSRLVAKSLAARPVIRLKVERDDGDVAEGDPRRILQELLARRGIEGEVRHGEKAVEVPVRIAAAVVGAG